MINHDTLIKFTQLTKDLKAKYRYKRINKLINELLKSSSSLLRKIEYLKITDENNTLCLFLSVKELKDLKKIK